MLALGGQRAEPFVRSPTVVPPAMSATQSGTHIQDTKREGREQRERGRGWTQETHQEENERQQKEPHQHQEHQSEKRHSAKGTLVAIPNDEHLTQLNCYHLYKKKSRKAFIKTFHNTKRGNKAQSIPALSACLFSSENTMRYNTLLTNTVNEFAK